MDEIKKVIIGCLAEIIKNNFGDESTALDLVYPVFAGQGDLSLACFALAKKFSRSPAETARLIVNAWTAVDGVAEIKAEGPYVNFYLSADKLFANIDQDAVKVGQGKRVMVEFANANTHKDFHIGHLRNVVYGQAVVGLLSAVGYDVMPVSYLNDFGIHTAKVIWQLNKQPLAGKQDRGYELGLTYALAVKNIGDDATAKAEVGQIMTEIEQRDGQNYRLWQETRQWSIDYFQTIYDQLNIKFAHHYYESDFIDSGRVMVDELLAQGILTRSQGAVIADLSAESLGVLVVLRQDGTALYPVADLALAKEKFADTDLFASIYVVDKRQSLYFQQLFTVLKKMGYEAPLIHLPYDFVTLPEGMMSSRSGRVVAYRDVYQQCLTKLSAETKARHDDWPTDKINRVAESLTAATLKYEMLKVGAEQIITFNIKEALKFEGNTAIYLLYTGARINSLLTKAETLSKSASAVFNELTEKALITALAKYGETVGLAARTYEPSLLAKYLFDLARLFNDFYHVCPILTADELTGQSRLSLVKETGRILAAGLRIINIEIIEEM